MNKSTIGTLEKVIVIGISLLLISIGLGFCIGIVTSDTGSNPIELVRNVYRFLGIVILMLIGSDLGSQYIQLNVKRVNNKIES